MKRFRIFGFDLDRRALALTVEEQAHWHEAAQESHRKNRQELLAALIWEFGEAAADEKRENFADLGPKPLSIFAFHNRFLAQVRTSFVMGGYYPALTGACALGERILNHLVLLLREDYQHTAEYNRVRNKQSFAKWELAISTLEAWDVLLPDVAAEFRSLCDRRNDAIHFRPEVDTNDRELALAAVTNLEAIVANQFSAFGPQPWFITNIPGEVYIKKQWETKPFVRKVYLPNCVAVGPRHTIQSVMPWVIKDDYPYDKRQLTDEQFAEQRTHALESKAG